MRKLTKMICSLTLLVVVGFALITECSAQNTVASNNGYGQIGSRVGHL